MMVAMGGSNVALVVLLSVGWMQTERNEQRIGSAELLGPLENSDFSQLCGESS